MFEWTHCLHYLFIRSSLCVKTSLPQWIKSSASHRLLPNVNVWTTFVHSNKTHITVCSHFIQWNWKDLNWIVESMHFYSVCWSQINWNRNEHIEFIVTNSLNNFNSCEYAPWTCDKMRDWLINRFLKLAKTDNSNWRNSSWICFVYLNTEINQIIRDDTVLFYDWVINKS